MARPKRCRVEGCETPALKGALFCEHHIGERRQCNGRVKIVDEGTGEVIETRQCKKTAKPGLEVCDWHGGKLKNQAAIAERTPALTAMRRFVQPYQGDLDPVTAFELEFRRTYARILWLEEQISALESVDDLIYGLTKTEQINAGEFPGTNKTYEARIHQFEEMLRWERKHFLDMEKVWIGAKLDERKLSMMRSNIDYTYSLVVKAVTALGHDMADPETRIVIGRLFEREMHELGTIEA